MKHLYVASIAALLALSGAIAWSTLLSSDGAPTLPVPDAVQIPAPEASRSQDFAPVTPPSVTAVAPRPLPAEHTRLSYFPSVSAPPPANTAPNASAVADSGNIVAPRPPIVVAPPNYDGLPMPVIFHFAKRPALTQEEKSAGPTVIEGALISTAEKPITITVTESGDGSQDSEQTEFSLGAGVQARFGTKNGLKMVPGEQILMQSTSYRDLSILIP